MLLSNRSVAKNKGDKYTMQLRHIYTGGCRVWSFSGRPDLKFKVRLIHRSTRFCITTASILTGATYSRDFTAVI